MVFFHVSHFQPRLKTKAGRFRLDPVMKRSTSKSLEVTRRKIREALVVGDNLETQLHQTDGNVRASIGVKR
jgi:hypothetical protein